MEFSTFILSGTEDGTGDRWRTCVERWLHKTTYTAEDNILFHTKQKIAGGVCYIILLSLANHLLLLD